MRHRLLATTVAMLVLALAAFTGTSLAGDGHGNGGGSDHGATKSTSTSTGTGNAQGVKPSSTTSKDTHAAASSSQTKEYGNGKTAGQIATAAGQGSATLHGPGNSQPHKTSCGSHEVDVHALKHNACGSSTTPATHASQGAAKKAEHAQSAQHEQKSSEQEQQSSTKHEESAQQSSETKSQTHTESSVAGQHVTICHATGSATNPYVMISPDVSGVFHGHLGHQDLRDIVPPFTFNGQTYSENWDSAHQAIYNAGCTVTATQSSQQTEQAQQTQQTQIAATQAAGTQAAATPTAGTQAATATQTATAAGGVKGATVTLSPKRNAVAAAATTKPKSRGGVLGATTRLGSTVTSTRLPFTGLPLWIFLAVAAGLILVGAAVRRSGADRV